MLKGIVNCFLKKQTNKKFQSYNDKKKFWQHISVKIKLCAKSGFLITRSCCSSQTCSIILQSMQDLRSNPQGAGNPNIPRSCTALLQSSQSAAPGTSVYHTHASPSLSKRCERFRSVPGGKGKGEAAATSCGGNPTHSPNKTQRVTMQSQERRQRQQWRKSNHPTPNGASWGKQNKKKKLTDIGNYPESPNENAIWISTSKGLR